MKKLLAAFALFTLASCAGMEPLSDADKTVEKVVEVPGYTKDQIYTATKIWLAENFVSSKSVIEVDDKESGRIIGNANIKYPCSGGMDCLAKMHWRLNVSLRVDMKDQKFKLAFTNMSWSAPGSNTSPAYDNIPLSRKGEIEEVKPALDKIGDQLRDAIVKEKAEKDW